MAKKENKGNRINPITLEGVKMLYRNFKGKESQYNMAGKRNFNVLLEDEALVKDLLDEGWNIKCHEPREEGDNPFYTMKVNVNFDGDYPPKVIMIANGVKTQLDADTVGNLDIADIQSADMIITPYQYDFAGRQGVAAYLKSLYVTVYVDALESKYMSADDEVPFE